MQLQTATIQLPKKLVDIFTPARGDVLYRAAYGGRGSGKSYSFALMAAVWGYAEPIRVLCTREYQASIKESFHAELKTVIAATPWLDAHYDVGVDYLRAKNGTEFIFRGLRTNVSSVKSMASIDLTVCEEAEDIPEESWLALEATVFRRPRSELWAIWNPRTDGSPVDKRFRKHPPESALIADMQWLDNPYFPPGLDLLRRREQSRLDDATYAHVWEGAYLQNSDAQVLHKKYRVDSFVPGKDWDGPYFGIDFGFACDPTTAVKCWIYGEKLWIEHDALKIGLELDDTSRFVIAHVPDIDKHTVRADSARPESISYLARHGLPRIAGVKKWPGSVEDGIQHLRSYQEIIIHERCAATLNEARLYSYKVDRHTGDILPEIVDANNHIWDAVRYALQPIIKQRGFGEGVSLPVRFNM